MMSLRRLKLHFLVLLTAALAGGFAFAAPTQSDLSELQGLLDRGSQLKTLNARLDFYSEQMLGRPYDLSGPLGEGDDAPFDRDPLWRLDRFDCTTYVETILSLSKSKTPEQFQKMMNTVRYKNGKPAFQNRNHFTGLDWIPNNTANHSLHDITSEIAPKNTLIAKALVEKDEWYKRLGVNRLSGIPDQDKAEKVQELRALGAKEKKYTEMVPYIPKDVLINSPEILNRIPDGAILNIVRPNWDLREYIGTHMNISHQGFAIRKGGVVYFREASEIVGKVYELPLIDYLRQTMEPSASTGGLNILKINK